LIQGDLFVNHFDEVAATWDENPQKIERARIIADQIRRHLPLNRKMKALEFGCGTGLLGFALREDLNHITLVDVSPEMVAVLQKKIAASGVRNMTPLLLDVTKAGEKLGAEFDFVFTMMALHHVSEPGKILSIFSGLMKPGGYLAVAELEKKDTSFHGPGFHGHDGFVREELSAMAQQAGFDMMRFCDGYSFRREVGGESGVFDIFLMLCQKKAQDAFIDEEKRRTSTG
jgi:2-polyprenyl-3-methyl-5-hydroxy-6-metoxy-1,4-benzoquinol methylase